MLNKSDDFIDDRIVSESAGNDTFFKAFIRVVKSIADNTHFFNSVEVVREPLIAAKNKAEVKDYLLRQYPQFFQNGKVYERETNDKAQFFYVVIFPLYQHELKLVNEGPWTCASCGQVHANKYVARPRVNNRLFGSSLLFCLSEDDSCIKEYTRQKFKDVDLLDDMAYITENSAIYIYKCTEKSTGKCYIGKTRNAPFFRWWNHLTKSHHPFGLYLRSSKLSNWTFEVLEEFPNTMADSDVFRIESEYIRKYDSIANGFNVVVSAATNRIKNPGLWD
jgi:hypothetical protein